MSHNNSTGPCPPAHEVVDGLLAQRYSCRAFLPDEVPRATIEAMLRSAQHTASWCNTQPWHLYVTRAAGTERLRRALQQAAAELPHHSDIPFPPVYEGVYLERRREAGFKLYGATGVARGDRVASAKQTLRNFALFDAPHLVLLSTPRSLGTYGAVDCGGWVANFLLAAQSHGIATIAQAALAGHSNVLRAHFAIPETHIVVCGVSFGYADTGHAANGFRTSRAELGDYVSWSED